LPKATALTEAAVKRFPASPEGQRIDRPDRLAPGLVLRVNDKGRKSWMVHFRVNGKQGKLALGEWPSMDIGEARKKSRWAREQAKSGIHPRVALEAEEAAKRRSSGERFDAVSGLYIEAAKAGKLLGARKRPVTEETAKGRESRLNRLILPDLGLRPLKDLTPIEISEFLAKVETKDGPVDRCLQDIRLVYKFAVARGFFHGMAPTSGLTNRQAPTKKSRALDDGELRALWVASGEYGYPFGPAVRLLMLTGQRRDEIGEAKWSDIDWERQLLTVPMSRSKNRKGNHEIPLNGPAMTALEKAQKDFKDLRLNGDYIFTSTGKTPISGWSRVAGRLDRSIRIQFADLTDGEISAITFKGKVSAEIRRQKNAANTKLESVDILHWRFHDLRHTVVTRMRDGEENEEGETTFAIPLDVVQQVVNHELTAGVTGLYDHGDIEKRYRLRKRDALEWWGGKLMSIVEKDNNTDNVVRLRDTILRTELT
jgi:integrase